MRIALILDDDVAAQLERVRRKRRVTLKRAVDDALRAGLGSLESLHPRSPSGPGRWRSDGFC